MSKQGSFAIFHCSMVRGVLGSHIASLSISPPSGSVLFPVCDDFLTAQQSFQVSVLEFERFVSRHSSKAGCARRRASARTNASYTAPFALRCRKTRTTAYLQSGESLRKTNTPLHRSQQMDRVGLLTSDQFTDETHAKQLDCDRPTCAVGSPIVTRNVDSRYCVDARAVSVCRHESGGFSIALLA